MKRMNHMLFTAGMLTASLPGLAQQQQQPKNIVFIAIDDLNDWVGFLGGHPDTRTPNMDRLARMGVVFENAYCAAPVSNASRAALLSGFRTSTTGVYGNAEFMRESEVINNGITLPRYFSNHGYYASARGKIFHQPMGPWADPQSWDSQENLGGKNLNVAPKEPGRQANGMPILTSGGGGSVILDWAGVDVDEKQTNDYLNAEWAAAELMKKHDRPFFLACGIFRPHLPWYVPQKYFDRFSVDTLALPPRDSDETMGKLSDRALQMTGYRKPDHEFNLLKKAGREKEAVRAYLACISYADDCVGRIVDALEKSPNRENTIVVLWGDHGWHLGEKMRYRKFSLWERSCRMPLIILAPGVGKPGTRCTKPVNLIDLYPTLVSLAGLPANKQNEGHDISPLVRNPEARWDIPSITTLAQNEHSIRDERFRYIVYKDGSEELYDHVNDPNEWNNLADDPQYAAEKKRLKEFIPAVNVKSIGSSKTKKNKQAYIPASDEIEQEVEDYNRYLGFVR